MALFRLIIDCLPEHRAGLLPDNRESILYALPFFGT